MALPSPHPLKVYICPGADPDDPTTWAEAAVEVTTSVRVASGVVITQGRQDEAGQVGPSSCRLTLNNRDGHFSPDNPLGDYYPDLTVGTPLIVTCNSQARFAGTVAEWPTRWDRSGNDSWVPLRADGPLRRLGQNSRAIQSALRRAVPSFSDVVAYWPMEESEGATQFASPVAGVPPILLDPDTTPGAVEGPGGSMPLPQFSASDETTPRFFGGVPSFEVSDDGWRVDFLFRMDEQPESLDQVVLRIFTSGSDVFEWRITAGDDLRVIALDRDLSSLYNNGVTINDDFYGGWVRFMFQVANDGSDLRYTLWAFRPNGSDPIELNSFTDDVVSGSGKSPGQPYSVGLQQSLGSWDGDRSIGHLTVTNGTTDPFQNNADDGYADETAADRIERLCGEENVGFTLVGTASDTMPMGPQRPAALLALLRECEEADGGILHEVDGGLAYRTRVDMYNQDPAMELDADNGEVADPPEPIRDDQRLVNEVTISRPGGSSATWSDEASISRHGLYSDSATLNVASDSVLPQIAAWRGSHGADQLRWSSIRLALHRNPDLIDDWLSLSETLAQRMTVDHSISQLPGVDIDVLVHGWTESIDQTEWNVDLNCSPASPWKVAVLGDRLDTDGSETVGAFDAGTDTTLSVKVTAGPRWVTGVIDDEFLIEVAGVVLSVVSIEGTTQPQTFTVDATPVNGVVKTIPSGSPVRLAQPMRLAL